MSNKQQTALEWYISKITRLEFWVETKQITWKEYHKEKDKLLKQAKEMEKEQIKEAREDGHTSTYTEYDSDTKLYLEGRHEQYYNKTYGGNNEQ